jgi:hypothetical protein
MSQSRLRLLIFGFWIGAMLVAVLASAFAPVVRSGGAIGYEQISPVLPGILGIFLPPLSCLAGFWFPTAERTKAKAKSVGRDRAAVALVITGVYLLLVMVLLFWPLYFVDYLKASPDLNLSEGASLKGRLGDAVKLAMLLSPVALAPIHSLTSRTE